VNNENSKQPVTRWDLIDALAKLHVIGGPSIGQVDDSIQIDPIASPRELLDITGQPLNPTTVERLNVNDDEGCTFMSSDLVTPGSAGQIPRSHRQIGRHQRLALKGCVSLSIRVLGLIINIRNKPNSIKGSTLRQLGQRACRIRRKVPSN